MSRVLRGTRETDRFLHEAVRAFAGLDELQHFPLSRDWPTAAVAGGVLSPVMHVLEEAGGAAAIPDAYASYPAAITARHMRSMQDLRLAGRALDAERISWSMLKGPFLGHVVYSPPGIRDSVDLDLIVAPSDLRHALGALAETGAAVMGVDWSSASWRRGAECPVLLRFGTSLDLHWHSINRQEVRRAYPRGTGNLNSRRVRRELDGISFWTPDDLDFVLHVLVHACLDGCARLRSVLDAQQCVSWLKGRGFSPQSLGERAALTGVSAAAGVTLTAAARVLDSSLTEWAEAMGQATTWTRLSGRAASRLPAHVVAGPIIRRLNRHTTPTTAGSARAVVVRELRRASSLARGLDERPVVEGVTDPRDAGLEAWLAYSESTPAQ